MPEKIEKVRPKKLTDAEIWNGVHQVVLKAALHNKNITVDAINETTEQLFKVVKAFSENTK